MCPRCGDAGPTGPYASRGKKFILESGSSASGRRRSLRFDALVQNLPQVQNLREAGRANTRVGPYASRGKMVFLESGSSASGRRRSLRFNALELNLPQVQNLREVGRANT